ncbi:MAG: TonB-dependent receptor [Pseudomonadota bacterium]
MFIAAAAIAGGGTDAKVIDEIVVSATRRVAPVRSLARSVTALDGEQLQRAGIDRPLDLGRYVAGLAVKPTVGVNNPVVTIRGIGMNDFNINQNTSATMYINGVPQSYTPQLSFQLFDLERVEVLKGPQGTLYGRNNTAGAINFVVRKPTTSLSGYLNTRYQSFDDFRMEGAVGGGVGDAIALRLSGVTEQRGSGFQRNTLSGEKIGDIDRSALRAQALLSPTEHFSALTEFHIAHERSDTLHWEHIGAINVVQGGRCNPPIGQIPRDGSCRDVTGFFDSDGDPFASASSNNFDDDTVSTAWGASVTLDWSLPRMNFVSITGFDVNIRSIGDDPDASPLPVADRLTRHDLWALSQELRLASTAEWPLDWLLGVFYSRDAIESFEIFDARAFTLTQMSTSYRQGTETAAIFGRVGRDFFQRWRLSGGLRYTYEGREFKGGSRDLNPLGASIFLTNPVTMMTFPFAAQLSFVNDSINDTDVSGDLELSFQPMSTALTYLRFSKGYKGGGFSGSFSVTNDQLAPFQSEEVYATEAGLKLTSNRVPLWFNLAGYYLDWRDFQAITAELRGGVPVGVLSNVGDAEVFGVEAEWFWQLNNHFHWRSAINWNDTEIESFNFNPAAGGFDATGNELPYAPEFSGNFQFGYSRALPFYALSMSALVDVYYQTTEYFEISNNTANAEEDYVLLDFSLALTAPGQGLELTLFARNLTDKEYRVQTFDGGGALPGLGFFGTPRTVGISLSYSY